MKVKLTNPAIDKGKDSLRVLRGGDWFNGPDFMWASDRSNGGPSDRYANYGFRLVRNTGTTTRTACGPRIATTARGLTATAKSGSAL